MTQTFTIAGLPAPQGSKRHVGNGVLIESSKLVKPWREAVVWQVREQGFTPIAAKVPVAVSVSFWFVPPKYVAKKMANGQFVPHVTKPDLDKLIRSTWDALVISGLIADDAQITGSNEMKNYSTGSFTGAKITITLLGGSL